MLLSLVSDDQLHYPAAATAFSPDVRNPEYRFDHLSPEPNGVYAAVRQCFAQAGLDSQHFGTAEWNPLGSFISPGQSVFVLCNFVYHRRPGESAAAFFAKCTHGSVVRAVIDYLLIAVGPQGRIRFGNAPVQSCNWDAVLEETGGAAVAGFYRERGLPVEPADLRMQIAERNALGVVATVVHHDTAALTRSIDLGRGSLLDEKSGSAPKFRVQDYDARRTEAFHAAGKHVYVVHRAVLESDVVFSIPKLKTHEKVGVTCAVKGCVGAIGEKDCLAHHRFGPATSGGDEYPADPLGIFRTASHFHDLVYRASSARPGVKYLRVADHFLRRVLRRINPSVGGAWWGNDTAWRMAIDMARIVEFCDAAGALHPERVRPHLALVDGVVGGEGSGPLKPDPVDSGLLFFCTDPVVTDYAAAVLMGFDPLRVPHVRNAWLDGASPMHRADFDDVRVVVPSGSGGLGLLPSLARKFRPPSGWSGHLV
jgi:uncharacterized protein (DUF362 family)